jgi:hypothetical protein
MQIGIIFLAEVACPLYFQVILPTRLYLSQSLVIFIIHDVQRVMADLLSTYRHGWLWHLAQQQRTLWSIHR